MNKGIFYRFSAVLLALLIVFGGLSLSSFATQTEETTEESQTLSGTGKEEAFALLEKSVLYQTICKGLEERQETIDLKGLNCTPDMLQRTFQQVLNECPQFFYIQKGPYTYSWDGTYVTKLTPPYNMDSSALALARAEYEVMMEELYALGSQSWSDLETVVFYHDYLAAYYEYDTTYVIHDAYNFLKEKKGVCEAYTLVFKGLMDYFEIPCTFASSANINHIWNIVYVDDAWYHLDVTHDDPLYSSSSSSYDLEGYVSRTHLLAGSLTSAQNHFTTSSGYTYTDDTIYGASATISTSDHPYSSLWKGVSAPIVEAGGSFYGILQDSNGAKLVRYNFEKGLYTSLATLSTKWSTVDANGYYSGNFSGLCTDGLYLYYNEDSAVYRYDTEKNIRTQLNSVTCPADEKIYGLRMEEGHLVMYTCAQPKRPMTAYILEQTYPVYYTITWIIDGEESYSYAAEGELPTFDGSTWIQGGNGISYEFVGWSPDVVPAQCDAAYTACYLIVKDYLPGDIDGDGDVTISDVTALLNYLSDTENASANMAALDPDGDGSVTISDVTALLNYLSDNSYELN